MSEAKPYPKSLQVPAKRKKYRRIIASRKQWEALRAERLGPCLLCDWLGVAQEHPSSLHHSVPKDALYNGDDVAENLVSLCGDGTQGHHGLVTAGDGDTCRAYAAMLPHLAEDTYAYSTQKMGDDAYLSLYRVRFEAIT